MWNTNSCWQLFETIYYCMWFFCYLPKLQLLNLVFFRELSLHLNVLFPNGKFSCQSKNYNNSTVNVKYILSQAMHDKWKSCNIKTQGISRNNSRKKWINIMYRLRKIWKINLKNTLIDLLRFIKTILVQKPLSFAKIIMISCKKFLFASKLQFLTYLTNILFLLFCQNNWQTNILKLTFWYSFYSVIKLYKNQKTFQFSTF